MITKQTVIMTTLALLTGLQVAYAQHYPTTVRTGTTYTQERPTAYYAVPVKTARYQAESPQQILFRLKQFNKIPDSVVKDIQIVRSNQLNAATNGSTIVITDTLWNTLKSDDQRAFVIGHELAHIVASHVQQTQLRRVGLGLLDRYVVGRYVEEGTLGDVIGNVGLNLLDRRSSRNIEYKADDLGLQLMRNAGYNPRAAISVLRTLKKAQASGYSPEFLQDHPLSESRIQTLAKKYQLGRR